MFNRLRASLEALLLSHTKHNSIAGGLVLKRRRKGPKKLAMFA